jgi:hypothetical protein
VCSGAETEGSDEGKQQVCLGLAFPEAVSEVDDDSRRHHHFDEDEQPARTEREREAAGEIENRPWNCGLLARPEHVDANRRGDGVEHVCEDDESADVFRTGEDVCPPGTDKEIHDPAHDNREDESEHRPDRLHRFDLRVQPLPEDQRDQRQRNADARCAEILWDPQVEFVLGHDHHRDRPHKAHPDERREVDGRR